ncbi:MAG: VOC family protein [Planctomycetota bacterium]
MSEGKVLGIGGVFVRTQDPARLAAWYREHLRFVVTEAGQPDPDGNYAWVQAAGPTVVSFFAADSDYFAADRQVMLNLRVEGLDALLARLEAAGVEVSHRQDMDSVGRFARIHDPDGNPLELWEPA